MPTFLKRLRIQQPRMLLHRGAEHSSRVIRAVRERWFQISLSPTPGLQPHRCFNRDIIKSARKTGARFYSESSSHLNQCFIPLSCSFPPLLLIRLSTRSVTIQSPHDSIRCKMSSSWDILNAVGMKTNCGRIKSFLNDFFGMTCSRNMSLSSFCTSRCKLNWIMQNPNLISE